MKLYSKILHAYEQLSVHNFPRFSVMRMFHLAKSNPDLVTIVFKNSLEGGRNRTQQKPIGELWLEAKKYQTKHNITLHQ